MNSLINNISSINEDITESKFEENLFVKNIIVNKEKSKKNTIPFIATERWIGQLGNRLLIN